MTKFDSLNLTAPHTMRELGQAECETSAQGDRDMKKADKDAIRALIGAIESGNSASIRKILWDDEALESMRRKALIEIAIYGGISSAIEFQRANLPNCGWQLHSEGYAYIIGNKGLIESSTHNDSPATALVVATLRAMLATNE